MFAPANTGTRYCATRCRRCQTATSGGVFSFGMVASVVSKRSPRSCARSVSCPIRRPLHAAKPVAAAPATASPACTAPARPNPYWTTSRPLLSHVSRDPATITAPTPSHCTGANRRHADSATRTLSTPSRRSLPALFAPATPITDPPNHSAAPRSWTAWATTWVSSALIPAPLGRTTLRRRYPSRVRVHVAGDGGAARSGPPPERHYIRQRRRGRAVLLVPVSRHDNAREHHDPRQDVMCSSDEQPRAV